MGYGSRMAVQTGLERLASDGLPALAGKRVGLICNPTSVDAELRHAVDLLRGKLNISALFGPELGVRGDAQDMITIDDARDAVTGLPEFSLYGHTLESLTPTPAMLDHVDVMVFDVQDIGSRYYTFVWTMVLAMRACAKAGKPFVVLDRPNPIGGVHVEGPAIEPGFESFVGLVSCPNRHGLTAGEIARRRHGVEKLDVDLAVITLRGWARGTTRPFELAGAPHLDGQNLAAALTAMELPGVRFRPAVFTPGFQKHAKTACGGVQLHVTNAEAFRSYRTGVAFLKAAHDLDRERFAWRTKAYEFVDQIPAIDLLAGTKALREGIEASTTHDDLARRWPRDEGAFSEEVAEYRLYD